MDILEFIAAKAREEADGRTGVGRALAWNRSNAYDSIIVEHTNLWGLS